MSLPTKTFDEHLNTIRGCSHYWRLLKLRNKHTKNPDLNLSKYRVVPVRCKSKVCRVCCRYDYNRVRSKLSKIDITQRWRFFTLTTINDHSNPNDQLLKAEKHFRELRKKLKRKFPDLKYFIVKELSPRGMWHFHGIWNIYIPIEQLSSMWKQISGAYRCNLQKVKNPVGIVNYIFKYMFKLVGDYNEARPLYETGKKKYSYSRGLFQKNDQKNPYELYHFEPLSTTELKQALSKLVSETDLSIDDIDFTDFPHSDELTVNLFQDYYTGSDQQKLQFELSSHFY